MFTSTTRACKLFAEVYRDVVFDSYVTIILSIDRNIKSTNCRPGRHSLIKFLLKWIIPGFLCPNSYKFVSVCGSFFKWGFCAMWRNILNSAIDNDYIMYNLYWCFFSIVKSFQINYHRILSKMIICWRWWWFNHTLTFCTCELWSPLTYRLKFV